MKQAYVRWNGFAGVTDLLKPSNPITERSQIADLLDALYHLDPRAFTLENEQSVAFVILSFVLVTGRATTYNFIQLRLPRIASAEEARRMKNPPLPSTIWRLIYPQP